MERLSPSKTGHGGFVAMVSDYKYASLEQIVGKGEEQKGVVLLLDGVEDPHNLGNIIRTAE